MNLKQTTKRETDKNHRDAMKEGWQKKKIGEVFQVTDYVANGSFATLRENVKYLDTPDYAVLVRLADYTNGFDKSKFVYVDKHAYDFLSKSSLKGGELIMSNVGSIGKVFKCPDLGMPMTLAPNSIVINTPNNDFYYYYFLSSGFQKQLLDISSQVTLAKFNKTSFKTLEIPVPPLSEQQRIVALLDAEFDKIDALKANAEKNLQNAKDLFQATLKKELEPKDGWKRIPLKEITTEIGDGLHGTPKYTENGSYFFVNGNNFESGIIEIKANTKRVDNNEFEKYKLNLNETTVLLSINGTVGKTAFYNGEPIILGKSACYINVLPSIITKEYVRYYLLSDGFKDYARKYSRQATIINLGLKEIRQMAIPFPHSLLDQQSIVAHLDALNEKCKTLQANYEKTLSLCDDLKQALLRSVFGDDPVAIGTDAPVRPYGK